MMELLVTRVRLIAEDIRLFELTRPDGGPLPAFTAGAHIDVRVADGLVRQYSLCNSPEERHRYVIAVLRDPASRGGSIAMHDRVQEGDRLEVGEPRNLFPLNETAGKTLLFAGGIGITPILCMAERLVTLGRPFDLHYAARTRNRMAFRERFIAPPFAGRSWLWFDDAPATERLDARRILADPAADAHLYVCGPAPFIAHILETATAQGWAEERLHREYFGAAPAPAVSQDGAFEVEIASTGAVYRVGPEERVIDVLAGQGIEIPVSCEQGVCGTCVTPVLSGIPDHRDLFLTEAERAANDRFTPCCSRARSGRLVLDL
ncbi:vanillate monooxygenase (plasmid) [Azospirillum sp. B510]|uniref:PDR/VanB family oxidoreductase n=1 Tax=Azospirillum sp. (strain B510) TaxID=137722 RepID=UPI0001C4C87C|nr:PDR/VanB family oxidoreductase [Azospirillum sp. B510]BAI75663.1 vanillate monooxygenase [Azospirillum sp. B510]